MTRPRGFILDWEPSTRIPLDDEGHPKYTHSPADIVASAQDILAQNSDILPLTLRQIFYMMVSGDGYEKTEKSYKRLCETMNKARRAKLIDMKSIRDDGLIEQKPTGWRDYEEFVDNIRIWAKRLERNRQDGQPVFLMVWCEAQGMVPQLASAVREWHVPVISSGGFDSTTTKHDMAVRISRYDAVEILHIGDHDPSGVHICSSLDEDLQEFLNYYGGELTVTRLAVTPYQVESMGLPTAPRKRTDKRSFEGETTQAEAIPPRELRRIVQSAVESRIDDEIFSDVKDEEQPLRDRLLDWVYKMEEEFE